METSVLQKNKIARKTGMGFFLLLAGFYVVAEVFTGNFSALDLIPLLIVMLAIAANRKAGFVAFGCISLLASAYITLAVLVKGVGLWETLIPSVVAFLGVMASLLVLYSCISVSRSSFKF